MLNGPEDEPLDWSAIDWQTVEGDVRRLRQRIFTASQAGDLKRVRNLQKLMLRSRANTLLSVRRVTEVNAGRATAGVDGMVVLLSSVKSDLADWVQHNSGPWQARPVKRVYIPKRGSTGKRRPLGIPVIVDRVLQARVVNALEPEWEARFEPRSYGFRPGRGCHDAIEAIFHVARGANPQRRWVLDADLAAAFDRIDHAHLLSQLGTFPAKERIAGWLKAGVIEAGRFAPTEEGTPQGGVQPTPRDTNHYGGYPGWIPDQQLTAQPPAESSGRTARVTGGRSGPEHSTASSVTAWAYDSPKAAMARNRMGRVMKLSFGTTLAVARARQHWVETLSNHGEHWYFNAADVSLTTPPATGARVVATARGFLGLGYLWAGTSGFGYDCSGFVHELYASLGVTTPRDTDAQAAAAGDPKYTGPVQTGSATGTWIPTMAELRPGDVVFFATDSGYIHHDGVYVGHVNGHPTMINSPHTGAFIEQVAIDTGTWGKE